MFTGIVEAVGTLVARERLGRGVRFAIRCPTLAEGLSPGDSLAVNGVCLTATAVEDGTVSVDATRTTLECTTLGEWETGKRVNLERAVGAGDPLGGHFVQGHVDAAGEVVGLEALDETHVLAIRTGDEIAAVTVPRGSLAVDGVSLTVAGMDGGVARFAIIPYTWSHTTLPDLEIGSRVNLEADLIGKYVHRWLQPYLDDRSQGHRASGEAPHSKRTTNP